MLHNHDSVADVVRRIELIPHSQQQQQQSRTIGSSSSASSSLRAAPSSPTFTALLSPASCQRWVDGVPVYTGLLAYRGILCYCRQQHDRPSVSTSASVTTSPTSGCSSSAPCASRDLSSATTATSTASTSPIRLAVGSRFDRSLHVSLDAPVLTHTVEPGSGEVILLNADEISQYHSARLQGEPLGSHSNACKLVLAKTHAPSCALSEVQARLEFGMLISSKLYAVNRGGASVEPHHRLLPDGRWALIIDDSGGDLLSEIETRYRQKQILVHTSSSSSKQQHQHQHRRIRLDAIERVLQIIVDITIKLGVLHSLSFVHKNLTPQSILLNQATHQVELLGLFSSSQLHTDKADIDQSLSEHPSESWIYLSAEQSGKSNRRIDQRSDLYSLGVILYELLVGYPPFQSDDLLTLIHMHLAKAPPPIITADMTPESHPQIYYPLTIASSIAMKLLNKQAEDRYQSTAGLISDLRAVLDLMRRGQSNALASFQIGLMDSNSTFRLSQRLYGREAEVNALIRSYRDTAPTSPIRKLNSPTTGSPSNVTRLRGGDDSPKSAVPHLFLISGYSGAGKTSLVEELHKHIVQCRGLYCSTKFDLFKRESSCLLQAFRSLILHFLMTDVLIWKVRLLRALGTNARVLCEVMPELYRLIGEENAPPVSTLSVAENANRFNMVFSKFVAALTTSATPLVIFIDDLQWADSGSLALLSLLFQLDSSHLLIIGAYRSNEVDESHPLTTFIQQQPVDRVTSILLKPLTASNMTQLLTDSFKCTSQSVQPLVDLLLAKTSGNPFHAKILLRGWYDAKLLYFDFEQARWMWKLEEMRLTAIHADVVDVICQHIQSLSSTAQQLLRYASCLGHAFSLRTLSIVTTMPLHQLMSSARECEQAGFIICQTHGHDFVLLSERPGQMKYSVNDEHAVEMQLESISFKFAHDRIQTAAYRLISENEIFHYHFVIARQLLLTYDNAERVHYCVEIVGHVMTGYRLGELSESVGPNQQDDFNIWNQFFEMDGMYQVVIDLFHAATLQSKSAGAYENALRYLTAALQLLQRKVSHRQAQEAVASHLLSSEVQDERKTSTAADTTFTKVFNASDDTSSSSDFYSVDAECWSRNYVSTLRCYVELSQCLFLNTNYNASERCIRYALTHVSVLNDRALFMGNHLLSLDRLLRYRDSLTVGLWYLSEFGIVLLDGMTPEIEEWLWRGVDPRDESTYYRHPVFHSNELSNPLLLTIISALAPAVYFLCSPLFVNIAVTGIYITMKYGVSPDTGHVLGVFAMTLWGGGKIEWKQHYALGRIACMLLERYGEAGRQAQARLSTVVHGILNHWHLPLRQNLRDLECAWEDGLAQYDYEWLSYVGLHLCEHSFLSNMNLNQAYDRLKHIRNILMSRGSLFTVLVLRHWLTLVEDLLCIELTQERDTTTDFETPAMIEMYRQGTQAISFYFARRMGDAITAFELANRPATAVPGMPSTSNYSFYYGLALLESIPIGTIKLGDTSIESVLPENYNAAFTCERLARADAEIAHMTEWNNNESTTFQHKKKLMQAQRNCVGIFSHLSMHALVVPTIQLFEDSIKGATKNGFLREAALGMELLSRFYTACHRTTFADMYIRQAYTAYEQSDLVFKLKQLVTDYPHIEFEKLHQKQQKLQQQPPSLRHRAVSSASSSVPLRMRHFAEAPSTSSPASTLPASPLSTQPLQPISPITNISLPPLSPSILPDLGGATATDVMSVLRSTSTFSTEVDQSKLLKRIMRIVLETAGATRGALVLRQQQDEWCVELSASVEKDDKNTVGNNETSSRLKGHEEKEEEEGEREEIRRSTSSDISTPSSPVVGRTTAQHAASHRPKLTSGNTVMISDISPHTPSSSYLEYPTHNQSSPRIRLAAASQHISDTIPISIFHYVLNSQETVLLVDLSNAPEFAAFSRDPYFSHHQPKCILCMPILKASKVFGVLYLENQFDSTAFSTSHIQLLHHLCTQAALSIDNARLYNQLSEHNAKLEEQVGERTRELEIRNTQLTSAKDEAEKATKAKSQFLSNMSHEIRTPMNAVLGVSRLLSETHLSLEQQQYLAMITNSGHLLLTIINDILDYSKIEAGELKLNIAPHNIVDTVETAVLLCYEMSAAKNLNLTWFIEPSLPPLLNLDATRLQQILLNLLSNAIKFTKFGSVELRVTGKAIDSDSSISPPSSIGSVAKQYRSLNISNTNNAQIVPPESILSSSRTPTLTLPQTARQYELEFHVTDTGIGLTPAHIQTLFKSFSQVQHISGEYGGTGLGLAISAKLAEKHGGNITVTSQFGHGSTFKVKLRASVPTESQYNSRSSSARRLPSSSRVSSLSNTPYSASRTIIHSSAVGVAPSQSPSPPPHAPQIHGVAPHEVLKLRARYMYIGQHDAFARNVYDTLKFYQAEIVTCESVESARNHLMQSHAAATPPCDAILIDLDSRDSFTKEIITEEYLRDRLIPLNLPTMRILLMYSRAHLSVSTDEALTSSHASSASWPQSGAAVPLLAKSTSITLRSLHLAQVGPPESPITPAVDDASITTIESSAPLQPFVPQLPFMAETSESACLSLQPPPPPLTSPPYAAVEASSSSTASAPTSSSASTLASTSSAFSISSTAPTNLSSASSSFSISPMTSISSIVIIPPVSSVPLIRRIKKPWKINHFLSLLVALLLDSPISPSPTATPTSPPPPPPPPNADSVLVKSLTDSVTDGGVHALASPSSALPSCSPQSASSVASPTSSTITQSWSDCPTAFPSSRTNLKPKITNLARTHPLRILLAEDNLTNQKLMVMIMRKLGYEILIASNGVEVLDLLEREAKKGKSHEIECILMDASMDVMDGMECTRLIRAQQLPHRTRPFIIAQTANVTQEYRDLCLESGMDRFSVKPIHVEELVKCLKAAYEVVNQQNQQQQHQQQAASSDASSHEIIKYITK